MCQKSCIIILKKPVSVYFFIGVLVFANRKRAGGISKVAGGFPEERGREMKLPDESQRMNGWLKDYGKNAPRYTPSLKNGVWVILALVADLGWLANLICTILYFCFNDFHGTVPALLCVNILVVVSVAAVQIGYFFDIYTSVIGEKAQQTRLQKNIGFGLPSAASFAAFVFGVGQSVLSSAFAPEGLVFTVIATVGAAVSCVACFIIFRSFQPVRMP